jgi:hypothetical protein
MARSRLELGLTSSIKWFGGIGEYRIDWGPGHTCPLKPGSPVSALLRGVTLGLPRALLALRKGIGSTRDDAT